jgi:hypothetical protein
MAATTTKPLSIKQPSAPRHILDGTSITPTYADMQRDRARHFNVKRMDLPWAFFRFS